jgi:4-amino-4-deoxy-L-arabinose transferase-like glycosyltransferase
MSNKHLFLLVLIVILGFVVRFFWHNVSPPGFTADEAVFGYNAYSLLKTGKDEFGSSWPVALRAFGDWRPALYSYLAIPFISMIGLNETAVRMPSILLGSSTVLIVMGIAWVLTGNKVTTAIAGLILALSPAHVLISRFADMSPLSAFYLGGGLLMFLWWRKKEERIYLLISAISFGLSALSYHNARLTGPLLLAALLLQDINFVRQHLRDALAAFFAGIIILLPLLKFLIDSPDLVLRRGKHESFLSQKGYEIRLWNLISANPQGQSPLITRFFYNKPKIFFEEFAEKYFSHFSPAFLFLSGDFNERFKTPGSGVYNAMLFILLPVGFVVSLRNKKLAILPAWWLISPLISAIGIFTPNSLHTLDASVPAAVMAGIGAKKLLDLVSGKTKILLITVGIVIFSVSLLSFLKGYFYTIPHSSELRWNWYPQTKELTARLNDLTGNGDVIIFGNRSLHEFILFNNSVDPAYYQKSVKVSNVPDENGFERVEGFGRFKFYGKFEHPFVSEGDWFVFDKNSLPQHIVWVNTDCAADQNKPFYELKKQIMDLGQPVYSIYYFPDDQQKYKSDFCKLNNYNL